MGTKVKLTTGMGDIELELFDKETPVTVRNFLDYVKSGHYNGTIFHRVIDGFMIQGGGMDADMNELDTEPPIKNACRSFQQTRHCRNGAYQRGGQRHGAVLHQSCGQ